MTSLEDPDCRPECPWPEASDSIDRARRWYRKVDPKDIRAGHIYWLDITPKNSHQGELRILVQVLCKGSKRWEIVAVAGDDTIIVLEEGMSLWERYEH